MTDDEIRDEAVSRLMAAAEGYEPRSVEAVALVAIAEQLQPTPDAIDVDGTGYMLDRRAVRVSRRLLGMSPSDTPRAYHQLTEQEGGPPNERWPDATCRPELRGGIG